MGTMGVASRVVRRGIGMIWSRSLGLQPWSQVPRLIVGGNGVPAALVGIQSGVELFEGSVLRESPFDSTHLVRRVRRRQLVIQRLWLSLAKSWRLAIIGRRSGSTGAPTVVRLVTGSMPEGPLAECGLLVHGH